jgi:hypothetical protein
MSWRYRDDSGHFISRETYEREGGSRESDKHWGEKPEEPEEEPEEPFEGESDSFDDILPDDWYDYDMYEDQGEFDTSTDYGEE